MSTGGTPRKKKIFVSYSGKDKIWLDHLHRYLKSLERENTTEFWIDETRLVAGEIWNDELHRAMASADAAILLVSAAYFASKFIWEEELPALVKIHERGGTLLVLKTEPCDVPHPLIKQLQMAHADHLVGMTEQQYTVVFHDLVQRLRDVRLLPQKADEKAESMIPQYDVFLAVPMRSARSRRENIRGIANAIVSALEACGYSVYCAETIGPPGNVDIAQAALPTYNILLEAKYFVMLWPFKLDSGVLVESGVALLREIPSVYFVHTKASLPYILDVVARNTMPFVHIHTYSEPEKILEIIRNNCTTLFNTYKSKA